MTSSTAPAQRTPGTLTDREILELATAGSLITENFEARFVKQACYELRAGSTFYRPDDPDGGHRHDVAPGGDILIKPKQLVVIITMESVDLPPNMLGRVLLKGKLFSVGLTPVNTYADPGFSGRLGIVLFNAGNRYLRIRPGEPIAKVEFARLSEPVSRPYRGQHGFQTGILPIAGDMVLSREEADRDPRVGRPVEELARAKVPTWEQSWIVCSVSNGTCSCPRPRTCCSPCSSSSSPRPRAASACPSPRQWRSGFSATWRPRC